MAWLHRDGKYYYLDEIPNNDDGAGWGEEISADMFEALFKMRLPPERGDDIEVELHRVGRTTTKREILIEVDGRVRGLW